MRAAYLAGLAAAGFAFGALRPSSDERAAKLRAACLDAGDAKGCERVADLIERGRVRARFEDEAGLLLAKACEGGSSSACARAQRFAASYGDYETFEVDVGCMLGNNPFACEEVAEALANDDDGDEISKELAADVARRIETRSQRALALHLASCSKGSAEGCLGASRVHAAGVGVEWNPREAAALVTRACDLGLAAACEELGDVSTGAAAIAAYRRACDRDPSSPHAWTKLARAAEAAGEPSDQVAVAYARACERQSVAACAWMAR